MRYSRDVCIAVIIVASAMGWALVVMVAALIWRLAAMLYATGVPT
jgi:hypothetical protein